MLYVSAGMDKAGTTYMWNLLKLVLEQAGHPYQHLSRDLRGDPSAQERGANNIWAWTDIVVANIAAADQPPIILPLRTHAAPTEAILQLLRQTGGKAHAIVRDPRDLALSMMDVVIKLEAAGKGDIARKKDVTKDVRIGDLASTFSFLRDNVEQVSAWLDFEGCIPLYYEDNSFNPSVSIARICQQLGLAVPADTEKLVAQAASNPNTKRNAARPERHRFEMHANMQERFLVEFRGFYERVFPSATVQVG